LSAYRVALKSMQLPAAGNFQASVSKFTKNESTDMKQTRFSSCFQCVTCFFQRASPFSSLLLKHCRLLRIRILCLRSENCNHPHSNAVFELDRAINNTYQLIYLIADLAMPVLQSLQMRVKDFPTQRPNGRSIDVRIRVIKSNPSCHWSNSITVAWFFRLSIICHQLHRPLLNSSFALGPAGVATYTCIRV